MATPRTCYPGRSKWRSLSSRPHVVRRVAAAARPTATKRRRVSRLARLPPRRAFARIRAGVVCGSCEHASAMEFCASAPRAADTATARLGLCATSLRRIGRRRPPHRLKLLAQFGDLAFEVGDLFPGRERHPGAAHTVLNPPPEILPRASGAGGELIEAPAALLAARPSLMQPGVGHLIGLLERPARRPQQGVEAVADHLADTLGSLRLSVPRRIFPFLRRVLLCHALSLGRPMPIYDYRWPDCGKRPSIFFRSLSAVEASPQCPNC